MNTSFLVSTILNGVLGARTKRSHRASRYLTGGIGGLLTSPTALMTAAGLAWGVYETLQQSASAPAGAGARPGAAPAAPAPVAPPPLTTPTSAAPDPAASPSPASGAPPPAGELTESTRRLLRLAV